MVPRAGATGSESSRMRMAGASASAAVRIIAVLVVLLAIVVFAVENTGGVRLVFLGIQFPVVRLPVLIVASVLLGAVLVVLLASVDAFRARPAISAADRGLEMGPIGAAAPGLPPADLGPLVSGVGSSAPGRGVVPVRVGIARGQDAVTPTAPPEVPLDRLP